MVYLRTVSEDNERVSVEFVCHIQVHMSKIDQNNPAIRAGSSPANIRELQFPPFIHWHFAVPSVDVNRAVALGRKRLLSEQNPVSARNCRFFCYHLADMYPSWWEIIILPLSMAPVL